MDIIDNVNTLLGDDLKVVMARGSRVRIAASTFSIYAFEALKRELEDVEALEFIFTSPTFVAAQATDRLRKERREFFIPQAKAAIALTVSNACHGNPVNQAACAQAIAAGVANGNAARATYNACWNSKEGVRPKWWRAVLRAGCVTALVARLA